ncbi:MAG TPA: patatin-like phospholipase family protein [Opitutaceae bacterium]
MPTPTPKPKRLAITISGAVSLGSYEAGVLYEVLKAIGEHNQHPDTLGKPAERIEIDVLTGASAGGMTAAIAAQVLLGGADRLASANDNAFYRPWVKEVDLAGLLEGSPEKDPPKLSILASSFVEEIARRHLADTVSGPRHPAVAAGGVRLGLAMSNVNGIDYSCPTHGANGTSEFTYTRFQDEFIWTIAQPDQAPWPAVRNAALACGAFPFAFRARGLSRNAADYPRAAPGNFPAGPRPLTYLDGGIFQNEPLGLAKNLVDQIDVPGDTDTRFYLFVAPGQKTGAASTSQQTHADGLTMLAAAGGLTKAIFWQARFQDWVQAQKINARIELLNRRAAALAEMLLANPPLVEQMRLPLKLLLTPFYAGTTPTAAAVAETRPWASDVERLQALFATLPDPAGNATDYAARLGAEATEVWLLAILLLEKSAGLEDKDEMRIYTITSQDEELGGDPLFAFAGFIDQSVREHDYTIGRTKARAWLKSGDGGLFPIRATFTETVPPVDPAFGDWKIGQFNEDKRERLRDRVRERLDLAMKDAGLNWVVRKGVDTFLLKGKINKLLGL